jgi:FKBP-type peptidyl-prolyl cis-trans isomerase SlpA
MPASPLIRPCSWIRLHLSIHLSDGTEALSTFGEDPLELTLGDGTLTAGTEALLLGLGPGAQEEFLANGNALFGDWSEEKLHWLAQGSFPGEVPVPGSLIAFTTPDGTETAGIVQQLAGDRVQVDFNHPLSGRALRLRIQILAVAEPETLP